MPQAAVECSVAPCLVLPLAKDCPDHHELPGKVRRKFTEVIRRSANSQGRKLEAAP